MAKITDDALAKLRTDNPRGIKLLTVAPDGQPDSDGDEYVFRVVDRAEYTRYRSLQRKALVGQGPADSQTLLARNLLLFPTLADFDALREKAPAITEEVGEILAADADAGLTVREGKR